MARSIITDTEKFKGRRREKRGERERGKGKKGGGILTLSTPLAKFNLLVCIYIKLT